MSSEIGGLKGIAHGLFAKDPVDLSVQVDKQSSPESIKEAATQFEGLLLQQMFKSMWATVPQGDLLSSGREQEFYRDMLNEALAAQVAEHQSLGIKDVISKDIKKLQSK